MTKLRDAVKNVLDAYDRWMADPTFGNMKSFQAGLDTLSEVFGAIEENGE